MASPTNGGFDLRSVCNALASIKIKWYEIGIQLGIPRNKLLEFKKEDDPLSAVVDYWLRGNVTESVDPISWQTIVGVLNSEYVGEPGLSEKISINYCHSGNSNDRKAPTPIEEQFTYSSVMIPTQPVNGSPLPDQHVSSQPAKVADVEHRSNAIVDTTFISEGSNDAGFASHGNVSIYCPKHTGREIEMYCNTCQETICLRCIANGEEHYTHDYEDLHIAIETKITSSLQPIEKQLKTIKEALVKLDTQCDQISDQQTAVKSYICNTITQLQETLDVRKAELISQLYQLTQTKLKSLAAQRNQLEATLAQLTECLTFMRDNLKSGKKGEVLLMKTAKVRQVKNLITTSQLGALEPNAEADMIFSALADLNKECQNYGEVLTTAPPDPSKCSITSMRIDAAAVGEKSTAVLQTLDFNGHPCKIFQESITCELVSEMSGTRTGGSIHRRRQSQYEISYLPTIKGRHQLHILVEGVHIKGSPFLINAKSQVQGRRSHYSLYSFGRTGF